MAILRARMGVCGLKNHYNVCYINSTIQSLLSLRKLVEIIEKSDPKEGTILYELKNILAEMKNRNVLDKRPLYKKLAVKSHHLFKYDNKPGYIEDFLEFIVKNIEKELKEGISGDINQQKPDGPKKSQDVKDFQKNGLDGNGNVINDLNLFLSESNYSEDNQENVLLKDTSRHMILLSRCYDEYNDYIQSIIDYITEESFILPQTLLISLGPIYNFKPLITIPEHLTVQGTIYKLRSIIYRKQRNQKKGHFYTVSDRENTWYMFNDEKTKELKDHGFITTDEGYMLFYEIG